MPSNERVNARKEKQRQKEKKTKQIIWIVLIIIIVALLIMKICEVDFKGIKNRFTDENGKFTISLTTDANAYPYTLDTSRDVSVHTVNNKLTILTDISVTVLNPVNAQELYKFEHGYSNPIISCSGNYFCLIDQGATRLRLDTNSENIYETTLKSPVLTADVANNGNVIYAVQGESTKSTLYVVNNKLKELMTLDVNDGYIVDVAIDSSGKKCAYATINSENAKIVTVVHTINVGDSEDRATFTFEDTNVLDLNYSSSNLYFVGDNAVSVISSQKKITDVFKQGTINVCKYTYSKSGELVVDYTDYSDATQNTIAYVNSSGKVKTTIPLEQKVKYIYASSNEISVLFSDKIDVYSLTKGEKKDSIACDDSVNSVTSFSSKTFIQRGQIIED